MSTSIDGPPPIPQPYQRAPPHDGKENTSTSRSSGQLVDNAMPQHQDILSEPFSAIPLQEVTENQPEHSSQERKQYFIERRAATLTPDTGQNPTDSTDLRCQTSNFFQVLYGGGYKASMPFPEEDKIFTQGRFPGLLETCHQLRDEALPVFSGRLAVASLPIRSRSTKSSTALGRIPAHYVQSVKDIFLPWDIIDEKLRLNDIFPSLDTIHLVCADKNVLIPDSMDEARNVNAIHGAITNLKKRTTQYPQWLPHQVRWIGHGTRVRDLYDGGMLKCYIKERGDVHFSGDIDSVGTPPKVAITPVAFWSHSLQADLGRYLTQMIDYSDDEIAVLNISVETDETCTVNGRACQTIYGLRRQYPMFIAASSFYRQSIFTDRERWDTERERWDYLLQRRSFADFASCI